MEIKIILLKFNYLTNICAIPNFSNIKLFDYTLTSTTWLAICHLIISIESNHHHFKIPEILLAALHTHTQFSVQSNQLMVFIIILKCLRMTLTTISTNMYNLTTLNQKSHMTTAMLQIQRTHSLSNINRAVNQLNVHRIIILPHN